MHFVNTVVNYRHKKTDGVSIRFHLAVVVYLKKV